MLKALDDWDWHQAFGYAGEGGADANSAGSTPSPVKGYDGPNSGFSRADVDHLILLREGENDGPEWLAAGQLRDGRWFYLEAGCDYTGWD